MPEQFLNMSLQGNDLDDVYVSFELDDFRRRLTDIEAWLKRGGVPSFASGVESCLGVVSATRNFDAICDEDGEDIYEDGPLVGNKRVPDDTQLCIDSAVLNVSLALKPEGRRVNVFGVTINLRLKHATTDHYASLPHTLIQDLLGNQESA
jgi:hypothetical protein